MNCFNCPKAGNDEANYGHLFVNNFQYIVDFDEVIDMKVKWKPMQTYLVRGLVFGLAVSFCFAKSNTKGESGFPARSNHQAIYDPVSHLIYVVGGQAGILGSPTACADIWGFDLKDDQWHAIKPPATISTLVNPIATYDPANQTLYVIGGVDGQMYGNIWALHLQSGQWREIKSLGAPAWRTDHTATYDSTTHMLYVVGGYGDRQTFGDTWALNLKTGQWREIKSVPPLPPRSNHTAILDSANRNIYLFGGWSDRYRSLGGTWRLNIKSGQWSRIRSRANPPPRDGHTFTFDPVHQAVYLVGGTTGATIKVSGKGRHTLGDAWRLDLKTGEWREIKSKIPLPPRRDHTATLDPTNGSLYVVGGSVFLETHDDISQQPLGDTWRLDLNTEQWEKTKGGPSLPSRSGHTATMDSAGRIIYVIGGHRAIENEQETTWTVLGDVWQLSLEKCEWRQVSPLVTKP